MRKLIDARILFRLQRDIAIRTRADFFIGGKQSEIIFLGLQ